MNTDPFTSPIPFRYSGIQESIYYWTVHHVIDADKGRIIQLFDNLLNNALKFTNEGTISISVESKDGQAVVSVKGNGRGIDTDILPKLFTKFASKSQMGTGLGLFISKSIEAHGGKIWAENNADDTRGATFSFSLPLSSRNSKAPGLLDKP